MTEPRDTTNPKSQIPNSKFLPETPCVPKVTAEGQLRLRYMPTEGVQVRDEAFGLLFYNYRGPRLYFVPSQDLIAADFFNGRQSLGGLVEAVCSRKGRVRAEVETRIAMIITQLEKKGLIYGQSIR